MVRGRLQVAWSQTSHLLAALARCQAVEMDFDPIAWMPKPYRPKPKPVECKDPVAAKRAEIAEFNALLKQGRGE